MGTLRNAYNILVEKSDEKRSLRRPRRKWEDNIGKDLINIGCEDVD
jgi:hypothetical protein